MIDFRKPYLLTSIFLMFYIVSFIVLSDHSRLVRYSGYLGILTAIICMLEIFRNGEIIRNTAELKKYLLPLLPYGIFVLIFSAYVVVVTGYGRYPIMRLTTVLQLGVLLFLVYFLVRRTGSAWFVQMGFFIGLAYISVTGSWQMTQAVEGGGRFGFEVTGTGASEDSLNPNRYAQYLNLFILLTVKLVFIDFRLNRARAPLLMPMVVVSVLFSALCAYQILLVTGSRKGMLLLMLVCVFAALVFLKGKLTPGRLMGGAVIATGTLGAIYLLLVQSPFYDRFRAIFEFRTIYVSESSILAREGMYLEGLKMWLSSPIWGRGFEAFRLEGGFGQYSHSNPVELLANHGLLGFFAYYALHLLILVKSYRLFRGGNPWARSRVIWVLAAVAFVLFWDIAAVSYLSKANTFILGLALGYVYYLQDGVSAQRHRYPARHHGAAPAHRMRPPPYRPAGAFAYRRSMGS